VSSFTSRICRSVAVDHHHLVPRLPSSRSRGSHRLYRPRRPSLPSFSTLLLHLSLPCGSTHCSESQHQPIRVWLYLREVRLLVLVWGTFHMVCFFVCGCCNILCLVFSSPAGIMHFCVISFYSSRVLMALIICPKFVLREVPSLYACDACDVTYCTTNNVGGCQNRRGFQ